MNENGLPERGFVKQSKEAVRWLVDSAGGSGDAGGALVDAGGAGGGPATMEGRLEVATGGD
jgi:hypothetical protein